MRPLPVRLHPGDDLRPALEAIVREAACDAAFVVGGIGSLAVAHVRLAGAGHASRIVGDLEILTLSGSVGAAASHLHVAFSDTTGRVVGGHVGPGCIVRTTAEVLLMLLPAWRFDREPDPRTGHDELTIRAL